MEVSDIEVIVIGHETRGVQLQVMTLKANSEPVADDFIDGRRGHEQELAAEAPSSDFVAGARNDGTGTDAGVRGKRTGAVGGTSLGAVAVGCHGLGVGPQRMGFHVENSAGPATGLPRLELEHLRLAFHHGPEAQVGTLCGSDAPTGPDVF